MLWFMGSQRVGHDWATALTEGAPGWSRGQESVLPRQGHRLRPWERLTDLAVEPREKAHTGAAAGEQPRDSPVIAR